MLIKLTSGYCYNLAVSADVIKLKKNIGVMASRNQQDRLLVIYNQVRHLEDYQGKNAIQRAAHEICELLLTIIPRLQAITVAVAPAPIVPLIEQLQAMPVTLIPQARSISALPARDGEVKEISAVKATKRVKTVYGNPPKATIQISYRNDQGKRMHAAFYDHYTVRRITHNNTAVVHAPVSKTDNLRNFLPNTVHVLGIGDKMGKREMPVFSDNPDEVGLLFIPGRPQGDKDIARRKFEKSLIKNAYNRGQPILAICAGSWQLWKAFGGKTKSVTGHAYSNMPYIVNGGGIGNNVEIHRIRIIPNTIVAYGMSSPRHPTRKDTPLVNSVHWAAPDEKTMPELFEVAASALSDEKIKVKNRQGEMQPECDSVEAFSTKQGAPMVGIQWHPEAYFENKNDSSSEAKRHLNVINYMAKAGDAYHAKRTMLSELKNKFAASELLKTQGFFKTARHTSLEDQTQDPRNIHFRTVEPKSK